jgi:hypothetical protein
VPESLAVAPGLAVGFVGVWLHAAANVHAATAAASRIRTVPLDVLLFAKFQIPRMLSLLEW